MKILRNDIDNKIILNQETDFKNDMGWSENLVELEEETLSKIINPIENYETMRYIHDMYPIPIYTSATQTDIWFYFYFYNSTGSTFSNGMDYSLIGITPEENSKMLKSSTESFFRLEFFKTPNDEIPSRENRKLVFTKNLSLPLGEKYFFTPLKKFIHVPAFMGSNYKNKENMYFFWFIDDSVLNETLYTGNTFWMSARFFNAKNGNISNFTTTGLTLSDEVIEYRDTYYKVEINKNNTPNVMDYSYKVYRYNGIKGTRIGTSDDPIKFYEMIT
jgi:hypothetical protein